MKDKIIVLTILVAFGLIPASWSIADQYEYDGNGRLISAILGNVEITFTYDNGGNLLTRSYSKYLSLDQQLQQLYVAYLGRPADSAGLEYWVGQVELGNISLDQIRVNIVNEQPEYLENYGQLNNFDLTNTVYQNLFNREADEAGRDYWIEQLEVGNVSPDQLIIAFVNGASLMDNLTLDNKLFIAECFTEDEDQYTTEEIEQLLSGVDSESNLTSCP